MYRNFNNNILPELMRMRRPMRRRNFIPNLGRGRRNLPIRFNNPRSYIQRNNQPLRSRNKTKNKNTPLPYYRPFNIKTGIQKLISTNDMMKLKLVIPINDNHFQHGLYVIPIHPLFLNQILLNHALNYTEYKIDAVSISTQPLVALDDATPIVIGYTTHCTPIGGLPSSYYEDISNLNGTHGIAHTSMNYKINSNDTSYHPIVPIVPSDVPYTFFLTTNTENIDLTVKLRPYITLTITFRTMYTGQEIDNLLCFDTAVITLANTPSIKSSMILAKNTFGFCEYSTATAIDPGELIIMPAFVAATPTTYTFPILHNGVPTDYENNPLDCGELVSMLKYLN